MSISFNPASTSVITTPNTEGPNGDDTSTKGPSTPTLVITTATGGGETIRLTLEIDTPMIQDSDVHMTEAQQALANLGASQAELMMAFVFNTLAGALSSANDLKEVMQGMSESEFAAHKESVANAFDKIEKSAQGASQSFSQMINSGNYPDANDFLKLMLDISNDIRKGASAARQASVEGQYNTTMTQAENMVKIANERYAATMKEIDAKRAEAIGQIVGGVMNIGASLIGAKWGATDVAKQSWNQGGQSLSGIASGAAGWIAADHRKDGAQHTLNLDLLEATNKRLDAVLKLQQNAEQVTGEIADIAKALRDMVLKIHQDIMSAQNQIIQRSNI